MPLRTYGSAEELEVNDDYASLSNGTSRKTAVVRVIPGANSCELAREIKLNNHSDLRV